MPVPPPSHATRVYHGLYHTVWQWDQELFDGSNATYECTTRPDSVTVIAFLDPQTLLLTRQEHAGREAFIDVPGGRAERDETAEETARREFMEETGHRIGRLQLFRQMLFQGSIRFVKTIYLATDLTPLQEGGNPDAGERIILRPTPWDEAVQLSLQNTLRDHESMLAILAMAFDPEARAMKETFLAS